MPKIHPTVSDGALARVGTRIKDKWRVDKLLGVGGMGAVYAATHRNGNRVALKVLHGHLSMLEDIRARFAREGYVANSVSHPGVVRVIDDDQTEDGSVFLVMDLLEGETADARARRQGGRIPIEEAVIIADGLLDVLVAAHAAGVVHRDIKPDNVFLTRDGVVKVLDFGIARLRQASLDEEPLTDASQVAQQQLRTRTGVAIGTPAFMPPEQALGRTDEVDALSDVWAAGATMFALLSGKIVHDAKTHMEVVIAAATAHAKSLDVVLPDAPKALVDLVDKALSFKKEDRYSSARAMQQALRQAFPTVRPTLRGASTSGAASHGSDFPPRSGSTSPPPMSNVGSDRWAEERKLCTVVFAELVGLGALTNELEPDMVHELANAFFEPLSKSVEREQGTVLKYIGDAIVAVFGVPVAHEDDAERAIRVALSMTNRVREIAKERKLDVSLRVGVNTGLVMVGTVGSSSRAVPDIVGATVNVASSIRDAAQAGEILVGAPTERLVNDLFELKRTSPVRVKGINEPLVVYRVEGELEGEPASSVRLRSASGTIFFARQHELQSLLELYEATVSSRSMRVVEVVGEMGLGKGYLLRQLRAALTARPTPPEILHAARMLSAAPLGFVGKMLRGRFGVRYDEAPEVVRARVISEVAKAWGGVDVEDGRETGRVLADLVAPAPALPLLETELWSDATRTVASFADWIKKLSRQAPVVMLIEQVQWSDEGAIALLQFLIRSLRREPVFLVVSARQSAGADTVPPWVTGNEIRAKILLQPFDEDVMERFLDDLFRQVPGFPREVRREIVRRAEGNPELCKELVRLLVDQGALTVDDSHVPIGWDKSRSAKLDLPDTVRGVMQARLDRLPPLQKETLKMASVIGRVFWLGALRETLSADAAPDEIATALDALRAKELVKVDATSSVSGERQYTFATQALCDAAYELVPRAQSVAAHRKIAEWLGARGELWEGGHANLAAHLEAAGERSRARRLYLNAARHAVTVCAYADAIAYFERVTSLSDPKPTSDDLIARAGVLRERAAAESRTGRFDDALRSLSEAVADLRGAGVAEQETVFAWVLLERGLVLKEYGRIDESIEALSEAIQMCAASAPSLLQMRIHAALAFQRATRGDRKSAHEDVAVGLKVGQQLHIRDAAWHIAMARLKDAEGSACFFDGDLAKAEQAYKAALEFRELGGDAQGMPDGFVNLGGVAYSRGDYVEAVRCYERALTSAKKAKWAAREALGHSNLGQAKLALGDHEVARTELERACRLAEDGGYLDVLADSARALVEVAIAAERVDEATVLADSAIIHAEKSKNPTFLAMAHGVAMDAWLARLARDHERTAFERARGHKEQACAILTNLGHPQRAESIKRRFGQGSNETVNT